MFLRYFVQYPKTACSRSYTFKWANGVYRSFPSHLLLVMITREKTYFWHQVSFSTRIACEQLFDCCFLVQWQIYTKTSTRISYFNSVIGKNEAILLLSILWPNFGFLSTKLCLHALIIAIPCAFGLLAAFLSDLSRILSGLPSSSFVVGDINTDLNFENRCDANSENYWNLMSKNGFFNTIHVHTPTRIGAYKDSILDHIMRNKLFSAMTTSCTID